MPTFNPCPAPLASSFGSIGNSCDKSANTDQSQGAELDNVAPRLSSTPPVRRESGDSGPIARMPAKMQDSRGRAMVLKSQGQSSRTVEGGESSVQAPGGEASAQGPSVVLHQPRTARKPGNPADGPVVLHPSKSGHRRSESRDTLSPDDARSQYIGHRRSTSGPHGRTSAQALGRSSSLAATIDENSSRLSLQNVVTNMDPNDKQHMHERGDKIRSELALRVQGGIWGGFGTPIVTENGDVLAIRVDPERIQDFRCLLQRAKDDMSVGANNVLLRNITGYDGCNVYTSKDGHAGLGATREGTIISVYKAGPRSPKEGERHRMPDLVRAAVKDGDGNHLACLAHLIPFYAMFGFDVAGVIPLPPDKSTPGWTDKDSKDFAPQIAQWKVTREDGTEVKLPLVLMTLNPERFAEFDASPRNRAAIVQPMDPSVFEGLPHFESAVAAYAAALEMRDAAKAEKAKAEKDEVATAV